MFSTSVLYALAASGAAFAAPAALERRQQATWPELDTIPGTGNDLVRWWASRVDWNAVPGIPATAPNATCDPAVNPLQVEQSGANCWWTCTQCTRPGDLTVCPTPGDWGLTFDDGPTPETAELLDNLATDGTKATFFIIASQAWQYPDILRRIAAEGHQIGIHTWSHHHLTSLSNEEIVAELEWSRELLSQIINNDDVAITLMRPPYGDVDDRVRAISNQLGLQPAMWSAGYDTNDWKLVQTPEVQGELEGALGGFMAQGRSRGSGFITLQHDSGPAPVRFAIDVVLPRARQEGWNMLSLAQCGAV